MNLFKNSKQKLELTEKTAYKPKKITLEIEVKLGVKGEWMSSDNKQIINVRLEELLQGDTDSEIETILQQIGEKMTEVYQKVEKNIEAEEIYLTNEFWKNIEIKKQNEKE